MRALAVGRHARADIDDILADSREGWGEAGEARYRALLDAALADITADPERAGSRSRPDIPAGMRLYPIRHSRLRTPRDHRVGDPRHILAYRFDEQVVRLVRVLHDRMDLPRWLAGR